MAGEINRPVTASLMICDGCGFEDDSFHPVIDVEEMKADPAVVLMDVKTYFQDQGWEISLGYDLCPNCVHKKETP
jgi:hypothetical protein